MPQSDGLSRSGATSSLYGLPRGTRERQSSQKWSAGSLATYALSPIDLIPDFIPVFGVLG